MVDGFGCSEIRNLSKETYIKGFFNALKDKADSYKDGVLGSVQWGLQAAAIKRLVNYCRPPPCHTIVEINE